MKKMTSLLLSTILTLLLAIPISAIDISCSDSTYTFNMNGKEMMITEHRCKNGSNTVRVQSADGVCVSSFDAETQVITVELQAGKERCSFMIPLLEDNLNQEIRTENSDAGLDVSGSYTVSSAYWNFSCDYDTARIDTAGTFWRLSVPSETAHSAYDGRDATVRGYANNFLDKLHNINSNINQANMVMRNAGEANLVSHVASALGGYFIVLGGTVLPVAAIIAAETVCSLIRNVGAGLDSAFYWQEACQYAKEAHLEFETFRDATESKTESFPMAVL